MTGIVQLISSIAWPLTVVFLALFFRHELRHITSRLSSFSYKEAKAEFKQDLVKVEGEIDSLPQQNTISSSLQPAETEGYSSSYERLLRIADISPRAAVMEAWREVEIGTKKVTDAYGISMGGQIAGVKAIHELVKQGLLPAMLLSVYERLRRLRSRAAHAHDFVIDAEQAERYIEAASHFYESFRFLLKQAEQRRQTPEHGVQSDGPSAHR